MYIHTHTHAVFALNSVCERLACQGQCSRFLWLITTAKKRTFYRFVTIVGAGYELELFINVTAAGRETMIVKLVPTTAIILFRLTPQFCG